MFSFFNHLLIDVERITLVVRSRESIKTQPQLKHFYLRKEKHTMKRTNYNSKTLYGNEISAYGLENGYVDFGTIMKCIPHLLCNNIQNYLYECDLELIQFGVDTSELEERLEAMQERKEEIEEILSEVGDKLEGYNSVSEIEDEKANMESALDNLQEVIDITGYHEITSFYVANRTFESVLDELHSCLSSRIEELENTIDELENIVCVCGAYSADEEINILRDELEGIEDTISDIEDEIENATPGEVFQYFLIDERGLELAQEFLPEYPIWHNTTLDLYILGVTHFGTSWDYVLTNVKLELDEVEPTDENKIYTVINKVNRCLVEEVAEIKDDNVRTKVVETLVFTVDELREIAK